MNIKSIIAVLFLLSNGLDSQGQTASATSSVVEIAEEGALKKHDKIYVFSSFENLEDETENINYYDPHFLGDKVARKFHVVKNLYVKHSEVTVGFGTTSVEVQKPSVYNALLKIENQLKKDIKKGNISFSEASLKYSGYLDFAYVIYYETDTELLERELNKAKGSLAIMEVFDSIEIKNY